MYAKQQSIVSTKFNCLINIFVHKFEKKVADMTTKRINYFVVQLRLLSNGHA